MLKLNRLRILFYDFINVLFPSDFCPIFDLVLLTPRSTRENSVTIVDFLLNCDLLAVNICR